MTKGIFITGTDTGVGKTYVACSIARWLKNKGIKFGVMKPVSSGNISDANRLLSVSDINEKIDLVNPIFLKKPLAPFVAAQFEKKKINLSKIHRNFKKLSNKYPFMLVEGIGGLFVPIKKDYFVLDLIKSFSLPVVVVARPVLGTINHTLLTVEKLKQNKIKVLGIVLNSGKGKTLAEKTNAKAINILTGLPVMRLLRNEKIDLEKYPWLIG